MSRVLIIANPAAGTVTPEQVWQLTTLCRRRARRVSVRWTSAAGDACRIATEAAESVVDDRSRTVVAAVGGDGTAREVAAGLASAWRGAGPVAMLIVPAGTANSCYHTLWGETPWPDAVRAALADPAGRTRGLDLTRLAGLDRLVLAGASAGFSPQAIHEAKAITHLAGPERYHAALVNLIPRYEPYPGRVLVDGRVVHSGPTLLANVGGSRYRGGYFELLPHSVPDDGLLDVCVIGAERDPAEMMRLTKTGAHVSCPGVVYERGRRVRIERTDGRPLWFEHDGEVLPHGASGFTLDVVAGAVPMLAANHDPVSRAA